MIDLKKLKKNKKIIIFDGTNTLIRAISIAQSYNKNYIRLFYDMIRNILLEFKPNECYIVFDGQGGSNTKRLIFSEYKTNRLNVSKIQTEDYEKFFAMLKYTPLIIIRINNIQGDDVIAHIALKNSYQNNKVVIISTDKDFYQLCDKNTVIYNGVQKTIITQNIVKEKYSCHPINFAIFKALLGDKSDNIPGIKGLGEKLIIKNFGQLFINQQPLCGNFNNFKEYIMNMQHSDLKLKLKENIVLLSKYYKIVNLRDGCILSPQIGAKIDQIIQQKKKDAIFDRKKFIEQCKKYEISDFDIASIYTPLQLISQGK